MIEDAINQIASSAVKVHEEVIKKLLSFTGINLETNGVINVEMIKYEMLKHNYEILSNEDQNVELIHLLHKGKIIMTAEIKREMKLDEGKFIVTYRFIKPSKEEGE